MAASTEWSPVAPALPTSSTEDLFDGDILGDELMDIYNAAVVGGGDGEIPSLLGSAEKGTEDDGFGAFRPSTSFNNLTVMLPDSNNEQPSVGVAQNVESSNNSSALNAARVVSSTSISTDLMISPAGGLATVPIVTTPGGTKRKATGTSARSPKRKNTGAATKPKPQRTVSNGPTNKKTNKKQALSVTAPTNVLSTTKTKLVATITPNTISPALAANTVAPSMPPAPSLNATTRKAPQATVSSAPVAASVLSNPPTEADFKSVAQAAVNELIMNSGAAAKANKSTKGRSNSMPATTSSKTSITTAKRVNTSTEHVKALTGSNWVAVCGGAGITGDSNTQTNNEKMCNRARRSNLTPDERARQNRDRNREHARNTRLRKKAYVEELKATLSALVAQRDAAELEKSHSSQRELEQREVRFRVLEEFLKLRGRNEVNPARWVAILDEKFNLTMPVVNFREMIHTNDSNHRNANAVHEQVLSGVTEVMNDSSLCSAFLQSLGKQGNSEAITLAYTCDRNNFFMDNCVAMLDWTATTHGASEQGIELIIKGHTRAKFCPASNKLISVAMSFDTGAIVSQVNLINKIKASSEAQAAAQAARVAANEADALLDSLQMPHFDLPSAGPMHAKVNVVPPSSSGSSTSSNEEKALVSSDDDNQNASSSKDETEDVL